MPIIVRLDGQCQRALRSLQAVSRQRGDCESPVEPSFKQRPRGTQRGSGSGELSEAAWEMANLFQLVPGRSYVPIFNEVCNVRESAPQAQAFSKCHADSL